MVFNRKDLAKAFSPNKKHGRKRFSGGIASSKPSTSGSTALSTYGQAGAQTNIKVIIRVRPPNEREQQDNFRNVVKVVDDKMLIFDPKEEENPFFYQGVVQKGRDLLKKQNKDMQFMFDRVFSLHSTNCDVFEGSTKNIIASLLDGYNCSVFVYGATGAGKTHTMLGKEGDPGITYCTVAELFSQIDSQSAQRDFNLGVSYLEVYNENVQDLLQKSGPLHIRDDGRCGIIVAGLNITTIRNAEELLALLAKGNKNRTQHPTDANEESSRSHAVFQVYVNITNKLDGQVKHVKLSMIDLAGSERASATGCKGARFKEGANINKSLLALGNCINNLADGVKHIPYRDSKLTRLLKDSLGGNCQTVMIANISPSSLSYEDTYNTLRYADRAKKIKTNMKKNIVSCQLHVTTYIKMVEELKKENELVKKENELMKKENESLKLKILNSENDFIEKSPSSKSSKDDLEGNKDMSELSDQLLELHNSKRELNEKFLALESTDKILCCRIQYKKEADARLHNLTATVDALSPERNMSGKLRINKSLYYFKRQRANIKTQMESVWEELRAVEARQQELNSLIESKDFVEKLSDKCAYYESEMKRCRVQQQFQHFKRMASLQQCELESKSSIIKMLSSTLQRYYNLMRGYGTMTDQMSREFKQLVKALEGVRTIKWSDSKDSTEEENNFYNFSCLSIKEVADPINNEIPFSKDTCFEDDDEISSVVEDNKLNSTFDASPTIETPIKMDSTVILEAESDHKLMPNDENDSMKHDSIDATKLNSTLNLKESKAKKRILLDKNHIVGRPPVTKLIKKTSPPIKQTANFQVNNPGGKENKDTQKNASKMSAKSIAILNKLKTERAKALTAPVGDTFNTPQSDEKLKAIRMKERRGLTTTHPYQKPNVRQKFGPAPPSSRIPW